MIVVVSVRSFVICPSASISDMLAEMSTLGSTGTAGGGRRREPGGTTGGTGGGGEGGGVREGRGEGQGGEGGGRGEKRKQLEGLGEELGGGVREGGGAGRGGGRGRVVGRVVTEIGGQWGLQSHGEGAGREARGWNRTVIVWEVGVWEAGVLKRGGGWGGGMRWRQWEGKGKVTGEWMGRGAGVD